MTRRTALGVIGAFVVLMAERPVTGQGTVRMTVYKDPACGCCVQWVEHLRKRGFLATVIDVDDMDAVKTKHKIPRRARSCHTGVIAGYSIEGHVPASDIQRLLKERPVGVVGLAVPGMPVGSPGMEVPGGRTQAYDVLAFDKDGRTSVFASHGR